MTEQRRATLTYDDKAWWPALLSLNQADTARKLWPLLLAMTLYTTLVALAVLEWAHVTWETDWSNVAVMHSLLGFAISTLLVFRTNTAYDRWYEGRRLWGALTNNGRNLAIKLAHIINANDAEDRRFFRVMIPNFAFVLKNHLRDTFLAEDWEALPEYPAEALPQGKHLPNYVASELFGRLNKLYFVGVIQPEQLLVLNAEFQALTDITGACERIKNTPIPYSYSSFLKKFIVIYCITLPFGYVMSLHYWVIPVVVFIFYVLTSLEVIAENIEDPFGLDANDLPTEAFCENLRKHVGELL
jgi:ion channel-forming bestrophin family protein